jgi:hypothetical protein
MTASRLNNRERAIPALTDHREDDGGVIGLESATELIVYCNCSFGVLRSRV